DTVFDSHVAVANAGFVAVDFYDGAIIYDFEHRQVHLCDLDSYRPGPYRFDRDRQYGSTRFMAPEEFERGATIDERTMVFTLGRAAFVFLSEGQRGENDMHLWRCRRTLYDVARAATELDPDKRFASVTEFLTAWRSARARLTLISQNGRRPPMPAFATICWSASSACCMPICVSVR